MMRPLHRFAFLVGLCLSSSLCSVCAQHQCSRAVPLILGEIVNGTTLNAPVQRESTSNLCGNNVWAKASPGVWYKYQVPYTSAAPGQVTITTCTDDPSLNGRFDSQMLVYTGGCGNLHCIDGNDDFLGDDCGTEAGVTLTSTQPGDTYYILIFGLNEDVTGDFAVQVRNSVSNDRCTRGTELFLGQVVSGSTKGASADPASVSNICGSATPVESAGVWYKYDATANGQVYISTCSNQASLYGGNNFQSQMLVYKGSCGNLQCIAGSNRMNSDYCGTTAGVKLSTERGKRYYILVYGDSEDSTGDFAMQVQSDVSNDSCWGARTIQKGQLVKDSTKGAFPDDESTSNVCGKAVSSRSPGVWFKYRASSSNKVKITTCKGKDSHFDSQILVYKGSCGNLECIAGNDDQSDGDCDTRAGVTISTKKGRTYYILVYGFSASSTGRFSLKVKNVH